MKSKIDPLVVEYIETKNDALREKIIAKYQYLTTYIARKLAFNRDEIEELITNHKIIEAWHIVRKWSRSISRPIFRPTIEDMRSG